MIGLGSDKKKKGAIKNGKSVPIQEGIVRIRKEKLKKDATKYGKSVPLQEARVSYENK